MNKKYDIKMNIFNLFFYAICHFFNPFFFLFFCRRKDPLKYQMLEKRVREPSEAPIANYEEQFRLLRQLSQRVIEDKCQ